MHGRLEWYVIFDRELLEELKFLSLKAVSKHVYRAFRGKDPESIDN